jgi:uncharacterized repeat protein (TIGR01451 family)
MEQNSTWSIMNVRLALAAPLVIASAVISFAEPAHAAGTAAGTTIQNTANVTYNDVGGNPQSVDSNRVDVLVDELLDVTVVSADPGDVVVTVGTDRVLSFDLTNTGNGPEAFALTSNGTLGGDQFDPTPTSIVIDSNGNDAYDPGVDTIYNGTATPVLNPDERRRIFVLSTIPSGLTNGDRGQTTLEADATTGTGAPGTTFAGQGQGGGAAVVGTSGADAIDDGFYAVQSATISFVKSQLVADPFGGARPVPGSTITYTLEAVVSGSGSLTNVNVTDAIPANTTYVTNSMTLQAAALTDAVDADAGRTTLTGPTVTGINVSLGAVAAGQTRTVTFRVTIN